MTTQFIRAGGMMINVSQIVTAQFIDRTSKITGQDDPRVIDGRAKFDEASKCWVDEDGERIVERPERLLITTTALEAETVYKYSSDTVIATSVIVVVYGEEAIATMRWLEEICAAPLLEHCVEASK